MKAARTAVCIVAVVAIVALPALAQSSSMAGTARMQASGFGFSAISVDETGAFNNPAGLPNLQTFGTDLSPWPTRASLNALVEGPGDHKMYSGLYAGRAPDHMNGWGAGYVRSDNAAESDTLGLGYGHNLGQGLTVGANVVHQSWDMGGGDHMDVEQNGGDDDFTTFDLAAMYRKELPANTWRFGLVVNDITDDFDIGGPLFDIGAAVELPTGLDIGATIFDVTDEMDSTLAIGAEWDLPLSPVVVRAGNNDGDFSFGAGYRWMNFEAAVSWADTEVDDSIMASVIGCF